MTSFAPSLQTSPQHSRGLTGQTVKHIAFQLACDLLPGDGQTQESAFHEARTVALEWAGRRFPEKISQDAWEGKSFVERQQEFRLEGVSIDPDGLWTVRLEHPDRHVAQRTWSFDMALRQKKTEKTLRLALRLQCVSPDGFMEPAPHSRPGVVPALAERFTLQDLLPFTGEPWLAQSESDLDWLLKFLENPRRNIPVYLLTQRDRYDANDYVINANDLAERVRYEAHVVTMPWNLGFQWTDLVGKPWSAFNGAVRTFRPGLDRDENAVADHPRILAERIAGFYFAGRQGPDAFVDMLERESFRYATAKRVDTHGCLFLEEARPRQAEVARTEARGTEDWRGLFESEIQALNGQVEKMREELHEWQTLAEQFEQERNRYFEENRKLSALADTFRQALEGTGKSTDLHVPIPTDYADIEEWTGQHLSGRLELHPRTRRSLKNAAYGDAQLVYRALLLLAREYRDMRLGRPNGKDAFEKRLGELSLRYSGSITKSRAGEEGDAYYVNYPLHRPEKRFLEFHLRKGSGHDERSSLAVYFFWDDETKQVVVGWLPGHLKNRMT